MQVVTGSRFRNCA
jgi:serine-type D-Ala-D-Ala carboxypeptidase (penicillin-binding protein 5/6)